MSEYITTVFNMDFISSVIIFFGLFLTVWLIRLFINTVISIFKKIS